MNDRIRFHQYRLTVISTWPDSEMKSAALASAHAALDHELAFVAAEGGCADGSPVPRLAPRETPPSLRAIR